MLIRLIFVSCIYFAPMLAISENVPLPGGYHEVNTNDQGVKDAANFAVQQIKQGSLLKIISAQTQVVAGLNYSLELEIAEPNGKPQVFKVVVFKPLPVSGLPMQVTSAQLVK